MSMMDDVSSVGLIGVEELSKVQNLKQSNYHRSQRLDKKAKPIHRTRSESQTKGHKSPSEKKADETKSVKKEKFISEMSLAVTKASSSHRSQRLGMKEKSGHRAIRCASQTKGHKSPSKKKVDETKSVKTEKSSLKLIGLRRLKPKKANNTTSTRPKVNQKRIKGLNAQTYEEFLEFRKYRQAISSVEEAREPPPVEATFSVSFDLSLVSKYPNAGY